MKNFFAYTRVSTVKQGEQGVSLEAQREAISQYATRNGFAISDWFEERETAAKRGRPIFGRMLRLLHQRKAEGVIIHKIDRSARNMKDWAEIGELIDQSIEVKFVNESLDLNSRGGRLAADVQAVVAADYIRNLREEVRKGFYGRIRQGFFPLPAPIGYANRGKAKAKDIHPVQGLLVRKAFELYGSGRLSLYELRAEMRRRGLRNRRGNPVTMNGFSSMLKNPFYIGLIRLRTSGETFPGAHEPLITKALFDRVQATFEGRTPPRTQVHEYLFRRLLTCKSCGYSLIGERQKGHTYYRCHTRTCPVTCVREKDVDEFFREKLNRLTMNSQERAYFQRRVAGLRANWASERDCQVQALDLRLGQLRDRLARLTDAYLDGAVEKTLFDERKTALLLERREVEEQVDGLRSNRVNVPDLVAEFLELAGSAYFLYESSVGTGKRELVEIITSNRGVGGKNIEMTLLNPFREIEKRAENTNGGPYRDSPRTFSQRFDSIVKWFRAYEETDLWHRLVGLLQDTKAARTGKGGEVAA